MSSFKRMIAKGGNCVIVILLTIHTLGADYAHAAANLN